MIQAMVLSSFLVACVAFTATVIHLRRGQGNGDLDGIGAMTPGPLPSLPPVSAERTAPFLPTPARTPAPFPAGPPASAFGASAPAFAEAAAHSFDASPVAAFVEPTTQSRAASTNPALAEAAAHSLGASPVAAFADPTTQSLAASPTPGPAEPATHGFDASPVEAAPSVQPAARAAARSGKNDGFSRFSAPARQSQRMAR